MVLQLHGLHIPSRYSIQSMSRKFHRPRDTIAFLRHGRRRKLQYDEDDHHSRCTFVSTTLYDKRNTNENPSQLLRQNAVLYLPNDSSHQRPVTTVMAPMVSASDYPFRCLVRQYTTPEYVRTTTSTTSTTTTSTTTSSNDSYNPPLVFTQMLHAYNLIRDEPFFRHHFDIYECCDDDDVDTIQRDLTESQRNAYNDFNYPSITRIYEAPCKRATRGPVIAQLAGHDVDVVVQAAHKIVTATHGQVAGIDLNLGCPQNIARKGNYGAYLMENHPSRACSILKALRQSLPSNISVSAKIRLPYDSTQQKIRLQQLCDTGVNFITIHGRDYTENKTTVKHIQIQRLIEAVQTVGEYSHQQIPVIVNGGMEFVADAIHIQEQTGAAAVMLSEALLERPNILGDIQTQQRQQRLLRPELLPNETLTISSDMITTPREQFNNQIQFSLDYIKWCYYVPPLSSGLGMKGGSFNVVRGHLFKMLYRYFTDPNNYDLRDQLGNGYLIQRLDQAEVLVQTLRDRYEMLTDTEWALLGSSRFPDSTWYRRHRSSSVFVHERMKPNAHYSKSSDNQELHNQKTECISVDKRKMQIRSKIEALKNQKKSILNSFGSI